MMALACFSLTGEEHPIDIYTARQCYQLTLTVSVCTAAAVPSLLLCHPGAFVLPPPLDLHKDRHLDGLKTK